MNKDKYPNIKKGEKIILDLLNWLKIPITDSTKETPHRVAKMYLELFNGLYTKPPKIKLFNGTSNYVCVTDIPFVSFCEHHLLPFYGKCGIVYFTRSGKVVGLSKLARLVKYLSAKPQLQENLTNDLANAIMDIKGLDVIGAYIIISAEHSCMNIRGVKSIGSITNTAKIIGDIDKDEAIKLLTINNFFK